MAIICQCVVVRDRAIVKAIRHGATDLAAVREACGAATRCGGCEATVQALIDEYTQLTRPSVATA